MTVDDAVMHSCKTGDSTYECFNSGSVSLFFPQLIGSLIYFSKKKKERKENSKSSHLKSTGQ